MPRGKSRPPSYYVTDNVSEEEAIRLGFQHALREAVQTNSPDGVLIAVQILAHLDGTAAVGLPSGLSDALRKKRTVRVSRNPPLTLELMLEGDYRAQWRGPVVVLYPGKKLLRKVEDLQGITSVTIVPWDTFEVQKWVEGTGATALDSSGEAPPSPTLPPILEAALESLTRMVNLHTGLVHPRDKTSTVHLFRKMRSAKIVYDPAAVRAWSVRHGWTSEGADALEEIARGILEGRGFQAGPNPWATNIMAQWKARARELRGT